MLDIAVTDFGPIREGSVRLRPLTVFVGPNNSGKSYMAMLAYGLLRTGLLTSTIPYDEPYWSGIRMSGYRPGLSYRKTVGQVLEAVENQEESLALWVRALPDTLLRQARLNLDGGPPFLREALQRAGVSAINDYAEAFDEEVQRSFGAAIKDLLRAGAEPEGFLVRVAHSRPDWRLCFARRGGRLSHEVSDLKFAEVDLVAPLSPRDIIDLVRAPDSDSSRRFVEYLVTRSMQGIYDSLGRGAYYLPAGRAGLMQSHRALASFMVGLSPLVGTHKLSFPRLSGAVADFIRILITIDRLTKGKLRFVSHFLEESVISGELTLTSDKTGYPEIYYRSGRVRYPMHRIASSVSELAPLILLLKYVVEPGDCLIIEEPEAHLHPAAQRKMAEALTMLVRAGVQVLITTHSDYLLAQLSNCVRRSRLPANDSRTDNAYLLPEEVGAYLFKVGAAGDGSQVVELPVDAENGIPEDGLVDVAAELYEQSVNLQRSAVR